MTTHSRRAFWMMALLGAVLTQSTRAQEARPAADEPLPKGAILRLGDLRWRTTGPIAATAYRNSGRELLTVGTDRTVIVWDVATGRERRRFMADTRENDPTSAPGYAYYGRPAASADGKAVAVVGTNRELSVWDVETGKVRRRLGTYAGNQLALAPDGKYVAVAEQNSGLRIWDVTTDKPADLVNSAIGGGRGYTYRLEFSADGKTLLQSGIIYQPNGGAQPTIVVWDVAAGKERKRIEELPQGAANNAVLRVFATPDHKTIFVPLGNAIAVVDAESGKETSRLKDVEQSDFSTFAFVPGGKQAVQVIGDAEAVVVWDLVKGIVARSFGKASPSTQYRGIVAGLSISPDGKTLAHGEGSMVTLLDLQSGKKRGGNEGHSSALLSVAYAPDGKTILTRAERTYCRWDAADGRFVERYDVAAPHTSFLLTRDSKWMIATGPNMTLHVFDAATRKEKHTVALQMQNTYTYTVAPDSKTLLVLGRPATAVQMYDLTTGQKTADLPLPPQEPQREEYPGSLPRRLATTRDGRFAAGCTESAVVVWDLHWLREVQRVEIPAGKVIRHVTFGPDSRTLAVEFYGGEIGLWEVASASRRRLLAEGERGAADFASLSNRQQLDGSRLPAALAYSFDGRLIASAGHDRKIRLYDARSGRELGLFEGHRGPVTGVGFSPDSLRLVTSCTDTTALVWDLAPLREKLPALPSSGLKLDELWSNLNDADGAKAYDAILALAGEPAKSIPLLRERLKPVAPPDAKALAKLIADLDAPKFAARTKSRQDLEKLGDLALPALKEAETSGSAEVRRTARRLIEILATRRLTPEQVRHVRAVEALELAGSPEARELLSSLAAGAPAAPLTIEAKLALDRLGERK